MAGAVTFQGFTIFPDTAAHRSMQREVHATLHRARHVTKDWQTQAFTDDIVNAAELTPTREPSLDTFLRKVTMTRMPSSTLIPFLVGLGSLIYPFKQKPAPFFILGYWAT